jgi:hypothetical protein
MVQFGTKGRLSLWNREIAGKERERERESTAVRKDGKKEKWLGKEASADRYLNKGSVSSK